MRDAALLVALALAACRSSTTPVAPPAAGTGTSPAPAAPPDAATLVDSMPPDAAAADVAISRPDAAVVRPRPDPDRISRTLDPVLRCATNAQERTSCLQQKGCRLAQHQSCTGLRVQEDELEKERCDCVCGEPKPCPEGIR